VALFPRIDTRKPKEATGTGAPAQKAVELKPQISIDEFAKVDLRVATVIKAEPVPKAKKLLKLEVDLGEKRTVVAGISTAYAPDELIGKQVIIVANLKPAKLMGVESRGMLIAAVDDNGPTVATLDKPVAPGTPLR
jgi:methionyl-tRNA synthetase